MDKQIQERIEWCYKRRYNTKEIAEDVGESYEKIKSFLKKQPYFIRLWTKGNKANLFFFEDIQTEEQAYWLGFVYADGWIAKDGALGIELKDTEIGHLEKFKKHIEAETEIKIYHKNSTFGPQVNARILITSKQTYLPHLLKHFTSLNKSQEGVLPTLPEPLMRHCVRGFFDGDGSLTGKPKEGNIWCPSISMTSTKETLEKIVNISGFEWSWSQRFPEREINNYQISTGRVHDGLSFLNYMYTGASVYLDRKFKLYQELIENRTRLQAKARV